MVRPEFFVNILKEQGIDFYAGVPDSLLKNICAYITDHLPAEQNIIAANDLTEAALKAVAAAGGAK